MERARPRALNTRQSAAGLWLRVSRQAAASAKRLWRSNRLPRFRAGSIQPGAAQSVAVWYCLSASSQWLLVGQGVAQVEVGFR
jgi:hypothetical protein